MKADPHKYDWLVLLGEDAEIAYRNNEYLKADYVLDYSEVLQQIGKLPEMMDYREHSPEVDRSGSAVAISRDLVQAVQTQVLQKKQIMDNLGPFAGRQFIQAARAAMGFQPKFKPEKTAGFPSLPNCSRSAEFSAPFKGLGFVNGSE